MDRSAWIVPLTLVIGIAIGLLAAQLLTVATRRGQRAMALAAEPIPDGVAEVVEALGSAGLVLDGGESVLASSKGASTLGLMHGRELAHPALSELVRESRRTGAPVSREVVVRRGGFEQGQELHLAARAAPLGNRFTLLLADDHSEEERLKGVRRDFVANVSHELKTPVGAISLLADAIEAAEGDTDRIRSFANRMQVEALRLSRMTKEIIELTRIQSADPMADAGAVRVDRIVEAAVDRNRVAAEAKRIRMTTRVLEDLEVVGDSALLTMAVQNLVANAVQYSGEATHVGVGARLRDGIVEIAVTDKGIGIEPAEQQRVFERFYRVDPARSRVTGGTGLGLSIVKHIAQTHGGEVTLWSQPGQGSTFTLRLPAAPPQHRKDHA